MYDAVRDTQEGVVVKIIFSLVVLLKTSHLQFQIQMVPLSRTQQRFKIYSKKPTTNQRTDLNFLLWD